MSNYFEDAMAALSGGVPSSSDLSDTISSAYDNSSNSPDVSTYSVESPDTNNAPYASTTDTSNLSPSGDYPMGTSGLDSQQALGQALNPNIPLDSVAAKLREEGTANPSFLTSLANQLGTKIFNAKDPLSSIGNLVSAIGVLRNMTQSSGGRQAMSNQSALLSGLHSGYNGAIAPTTIQKAAYVNPASFVTQPPNSTGPLTLVKTS
jgi:hypothetical protein